MSSSEILSLFLIQAQDIEVSRCKYTTHIGKEEKMYFYPTNSLIEEILMQNVLMPRVC